MKRQKKRKRGQKHNKKNKIKLQLKVISIAGTTTILKILMI